MGTLYKQNKTRQNKTKLNNKLNEFNLYGNFEQNLKCECISKSTGKICERRSSYNINGKNYCNQHSRSIISQYLDKDKDKEGIQKYGEFKNVSLTDDEYSKLKKMFPKDLDKRIQVLDDYIQSKGVKYKDFVATLRNWARKDGYVFPEEERERQEINMTVEEYFKGGKKYE